MTVNLARVRWEIAYLLNKSPRACWCNLVEWALHRQPLTGEGGVFQEGTRQCRADAAEQGCCYCAKFTTAEFRQARETSS